MKGIVIFGTGDIGQLAQFYFEHDSPHQVVAFCADKAFIQAREFQGRPLVAFEDVQKIYPPTEYGMFVALSYAKLNQVRAQKYFEAKEKGYELVSYVSSRSVMWGDTEMGDNCFIFENQTIQPFVKIGNNVTLWSGNHIGHHSAIGDHAFLTSHIVVSGHCRVGPYAFLGVNSALRDGITLAEGTVVGAGATVVKDTEPWGVYTGTPAKLTSKEAPAIEYFANTNYGARQRKEPKA